MSGRGVETTGDAVRGDDQRGGRASSGLVRRRMGSNRRDFRRAAQAMIMHAITEG